MAGEKLIMQKLQKLEKEVTQIKAQMADIDSVMTEEDYLALMDYRKQKASGRLLSHEQVKKELRA